MLRDLTLIGWLTGCVGGWVEDGRGGGELGEGGGEMLNVCLFDELLRRLAGYLAGMVVGWLAGTYLQTFQYTSRSRILPSCFYSCSRVDSVLIPSTDWLAG